MGVRMVVKIVLRIAYRKKLTLLNLFKIGPSKNANAALRTSMDFLGKFVN